MATWAASGDARLMRWRRAGGYVLAARHGLRFLGEDDALDECEARVRDALRSKA